jgi:hypothetical protein
MSMIQFGLPLLMPSTQTIIPILDTYGKAEGFFPITSTTFTGTETSYMLPDGPVAVTTVTLPPKVQNNTNVSRVSQYVAAVYDPAQVSLKPWLGYKEFVSSAIPNNIGFYSWWSMPPGNWFQHFGAGIFINSFEFGMNEYVYTAPTSQGAPTVGNPNATLTWSCTVDLAAFANNSASFLDLNWLDLFNASLENNPNYSPGQQIIPLSITTTSNPPGGYFKASIVQALGAQVTLPGGGQLFDSIRILRLMDPPAGTYDFSFNIEDNLGNTTPVTLTLTVN